MDVEILQRFSRETEPFVMDIDNGNGMELSIR